MARWAGVNLMTWHAMPVIFQQQYIAARNLPIEAAAEARRFFLQRQEPEPKEEGQAQ